MEKLAAIIPRPAINLVVYHGARAPHARWRPGVVAYCRTDGDPATERNESTGRAGAGRPGADRPRYWRWAALMRLAFGYRDEDYLKLKIVAAFLHPLTRSSEKDPL